MGGFDMVGDVLELETSIWTFKLKATVCHWHQHMAWMKQVSGMRRKAEQAQWGGRELRRWLWKGKKKKKNRSEQCSPTIILCKGSFLCGSEIQGLAMLEGG